MPPKFSPEARDALLNFGIDPQGIRTDQEYRDVRQRIIENIISRHPELADQIIQYLWQSNPDNTKALRNIK